jgi:integrase
MTGNVDLPVASDLMPPEAAVGYAEERRTYYLARYKDENGRYPAVRDAEGNVIRYPTRKTAKKAADTEETEQAAGRRAAAAEHADGRIKFAPWASKWYAAQDLDEDTLDTYRSIIECHLIGFFGEEWLDEISRIMIGEWETGQRAAGYMPKTISNRRNLLSEMLGDAVDDPTVTLTANPVPRRRGRGRRAEALPELPDTDLEDDDDEDDDDDFTGKVITDPLGTLLIAERAAIMSGRDDEFVMVILVYYLGLRWGEIVGLQVKHAVPGRIRIMWQLRERRGRFVLKRPKFGKTRRADTAPFLDQLVASHLERTAPQPCACHGRTFMFAGHGQARGQRQQVTVADVARIAGVSQATVSAEMNRPATVAASTRTRIEAAITETGYVRRPQTGRTPHMFRSGFGQWIWWPAVSGWYPERTPMPRRKVPIAAEPWPGLPVRGRGATARADSSWPPLADGMPPHGLRHGHKSWMAQEGTPEVMSHDRLGHKMPGIAGVYSHPTPVMRAELKARLQRAWEDSLDARLAMSASSPVPVLAGLLKERAVRRIPTDFPRDHV